MFLVGEPIFYESLQISFKSIKNSGQHSMHACVFALVVEEVFHSLGCLQFFTVALKLGKNSTGSCPEVTGFSRPSSPINLAPPTERKQREGNLPA